MNSVVETDAIPMPTAAELADVMLWVDADNADLADQRWTITALGAAVAAADACAAYLDDPTMQAAGVMAARYELAGRLADEEEGVVVEVEDQARHQALRDRAAEPDRWPVAFGREG